jgi:hypothetical protein
VNHNTYGDHSGLQMERKLSNPWTQRQPVPEFVLPDDRPCEREAYYQSWTAARLGDYS